MERGQHRLGHPDVDPFDENAAGLTAHHGLHAPVPKEEAPEDSVPLFLSDPMGAPDPAEYFPPLRQRKQKPSISPRMTVCAAALATVAVLFGLFSSDATRNMVSITASIAGVSPNSSVKKPDPSQLTPHDRQLSEAPLQPAQTDQAFGSQSVATTALAPTREEIKNAYQSALQRTLQSNAAPPLQSNAPPAAAAIPVDAIHHLDPDEIEASLKRGEALIRSGDLAAARLVLRRAADAGDARAAMKFAETYDPAVLAKLGVHGVVPDLGMARDWYEKAKQFGALQAAERLELLAKQR